MMRIRRMMRQHMIAVMLGSALVATPFDVQAQAPRFEVASVRVLPQSNGLPPGFAMNPRITPGRLTWTTTLHRLIVYAYDDVPGWRLSGIEPDWTSFYSIAATMDPSANRDDVRLMFRQLLAERFKLVLRTKVEQRSGYALVVASSGANLRTASEDGTVPPMPDYMNAQTPAAFEGFIFESFEGEGVSAITGRGVPITKLANAISGVVEQPVMDRTGLAGEYYFGFRFRSPDYVGAEPVDAPSLFDAVQEELGLELERTSGPTELLVVEHVEHVPTEN
jgi:uncharacterized protein (TIGR03435 family)